MYFQTIPIDVDDIVDTAHVTGSDIATAVAIVVVAVLVAMIVRRLMRKWLLKIDGLPDAAASAVWRSTGYLIVFTGVMLALPWLGFQTQPVLLMMFFVALLVVFAGRPLLESFTAGIILQVRSPFGVGDLIQHGDFVGIVEETNARTTVIITPDGETVAITNAAMLSEPITNLSAEGARRTTVHVGVAYGTDLDTAVHVITRAVEGLGTVLDEPPPAIGVVDYEDSAIRIRVWCWHLPSMMDEFVARDQIIRSIDRSLATAGIVIAFPQRDVWLRKPSSDISCEEQS